MMQSWRTNAQAWTQAVRNHAIESRRLTTDAAITHAVLRSQPTSILDMGCGEGWLCRALAEHHIETVGIDASPELIEQASALGGEFHVGAYDAMPDLGRSFDAIVCNFSLLEEDLDQAMQQFGKLLKPEGILLIQTVHPDFISDESEGWQVERFAGFGNGFSQVMPWYFRSTASWVKLLTRNGFKVDEVTKPVHPTTQRPLSLLIQSRLLPKN
jgi:2-polyprenyl-3-methyl-5-hydroxy-6-metoxy-1,4-benzoquinol methylase